MSIAERFLIALLIVFTVPWLLWRLGRTDRWAPLVVVQILLGIVLGPGVLGHWFPAYYEFVFRPEVIHTLNGLAWWAVMLFVMLAGVELDLKQAWRHRHESGITAGLALGMPLLMGCGAALVMLQWPHGWLGPQAQPWQFVRGIGMACAVTALPILVLFLEKLALLRQPLGQRILRYASLDDIAIWGVLAIIVMDWARVGRQAMFLLGFVVAGWLCRTLMRRVSEPDRWYLALVWLVACALGADWSGLHFMVGAFLAGAVLDAEWFDQEKMDLLRPLHWPAHELDQGRSGRAAGGGPAARGRRGRQAGGRAPGRPRTGLGQGRKHPDRLAAADQGPDHDHLREHPAGPRDHHQRYLHRPAPDGRGQHHADHPDGRALPGRAAPGRIGRHAGTAQIIPPLTEITCPEM